MGLVDHSWDPRGEAYGVEMGPSTYLDHGYGLLMN